MRCQFACLLLVAVVLLPVHAETPARKDHATPIHAKAPESAIDAGNIRYTLPFEVPTAKEVLAALPADKRPANPRIDCKLLVYRVDPVRFFPLVGPAQLVHVHFECKVNVDGRSEVIYIDKDHLIQAASVKGSGDSKSKDR